MKPGSSRLIAKLLAIFGVLAICALAPAVAGARVTVPPGSTEGDQYFEQAPNGGGSGSVNSGGGGSGGGASAAATQALNALGAAGQRAAALANANRPPELKTPGPNAAPNAQPQSSTEGGGGMGFLFPLLLAAFAVAAIAYGARRRFTAA